MTINLLFATSVLRMYHQRIMEKTLILSQRKVCRYRRRKSKDKQHTGQIEDKKTKNDPQSPSHIIKD